MIIFPDKLRACNNPKPTLVITPGWGTMDKWTIDLSASFIPFSVQNRAIFAVIGKKIVKIQKNVCQHEIYSHTEFQTFLSFAEECPR